MGKAAVSTGAQIARAYPARTTKLQLFQEDLLGHAPPMRWRLSCWTSANPKQQKRGEKTGQWDAAQVGSCSSPGGCVCHQGAAKVPVSDAYVTRVLPGPPFKARGSFFFVRCKANRIMHIYLDTPHNPGLRTRKISSELWASTTTSHDHTMPTSRHPGSCEPAPCGPTTGSQTAADRQDRQDGQDRQDSSRLTYRQTYSE